MTDPLRGNEIQAGSSAVMGALATLLVATYLDEVPDDATNDAWRAIVATARDEYDLLRAERRAFEESAERLRARNREVLVHCEIMRLYEKLEDDNWHEAAADVQRLANTVAALEAEVARLRGDLAAANELIRVYVESGYEDPRADAEARARLAQSRGDVERRPIERKR